MLDRVKKSLFFDKMSALFRLFWIVYDLKPYITRQVDIKSFETKDEAIEAGIDILKSIKCIACELEAGDETIERWIKYGYIHFEDKWHGFKLQIYSDDSYMEVFKDLPHD
jgi:hypothetical protein